MVVVDTVTEPAAAAAAAAAVLKAPATLAVKTLA